MEKNPRVVSFRHGWMQELGIHLSVLLSFLRASLPVMLSLLPWKRMSIFSIDWSKTLRVITDWPNMDHMPIPEPVAETRGLE